MARVAFIGLGNMGGGMAANLAKAGHDVAAFDLSEAALELPLAQGINFERRLFHGLFGTEDQKEGMAAFVEKRPGNWKGK